MMFKKQKYNSIIYNKNSILNTINNLKCEI